MSVARKRPRLSGDRRAEVAAELRTQYERGAGIRSLMDTTGFSHAMARKLLAEAGTPLRGRGGDRRSPSVRPGTGTALRESYGHE